MSSAAPIRKAPSYFADVEPIKFEGLKSENPLAYRYYDKDRVVLGKRMEDHLRFAACYWHSFVWPGLDPFGGETFQRPWMQPGDAMERARQTRRAVGGTDLRSIAIDQRPLQRCGQHAAPPHGARAAADH